MSYVSDFSSGANFSPITRACRKSWYMCSPSSPKYLFNEYKYHDSLQTHLIAREWRHGSDKTQTTNKQTGMVVDFEDFFKGKSRCS